MKNFKVVGNIGEMKIEILCEKWQIPMIRRQLREQGTTDIQVLPDFDYERRERVNNITRKLGRR